jgi:hypothetical protein
MYFRNKFNEEFLQLCDLIPKGASTKIGSYSSLFFEFRRNPHTNRVLVLPLVLCNKLRSTNSHDINLQDYAMLCESKQDTTIYAEYDENYTQNSTEQYICDIASTTGDFIEEE